jgi:hypothetical protein
LCGKKNCFKTGFTVEFRKVEATRVKLDMNIRLAAQSGLADLVLSKLTWVAKVDAEFHIVNELILSVKNIKQFRIHPQNNDLNVQQVAVHLQDNDLSLSYMY